MRGKIKWFSTEKGYGFIVGEDSIDRFFGVRSIIGADLPKNLDEVEFNTFQGKKGPVAKDVKIIKKANTAPNLKDNRVECKKCHKYCIPRLWHYGGSIITYQTTQHLCPFCGTVMYESGGGFNIIAKVILVVIGLSFVTSMISQLFQ